MGHANARQVMYRVERLVVPTTVRRMVAKRAPPLSCQRARRVRHHMVRTDAASMTQPEGCPPLYPACRHLRPRRPPHTSQEGSERRCGARRELGADMRRVVAIANGKGGVGKTSLTAGL